MQSILYSNRNYDDKTERPQYVVYILIESKIMIQLKKNITTFA